MLTPEETFEAKAMQARGWAISRIARHLGRDRRTIRGYLTGQRVPGVRRSGPDALEQFTDYCRRRLTEEPRLTAAALFEELVELGYQRAYPTFARALRQRGLRSQPRHTPPTGAEANQANTPNAPASEEAVPGRHASKPLAGARPQPHRPAWRHFVVVTVVVTPTRSPRPFPAGRLPTLG
jgi:hypothetical protein